MDKRLIKSDFKDYTTRGSNTNNIIEVIFRLFKDIPLERTKAYNLVQLVDFIVTSFNSYYRQRLLDVIMNKVNVKRFLPNDKDVNPKDITDMENLQYLVRSSNSEENYFVDMHICRCSCPQGFNGKICKHQSAVIKKFNINFACNILSEEQKRTLYTIATGKKPSDHLLMPLLLSS